MGDRPIPHRQNGINTEADLPLVILSLDFVGRSCFAGVENLWLEIEFSRGFCWSCEEICWSLLKRSCGLLSRRVLLCEREEFCCGNKSFVEKTVFVACCYALDPV